MKRLLLSTSLLAASLFSPSWAADNIVINDALGNFQTICATDSGGVKTICSTATLSGDITIGDVTIGDGDDATQGAKADAADVVVAADSTVMSLLKGLVTILGASGNIDDSLDNLEIYLAKLSTSTLNTIAGGTATATTALAVGGTYYATPSTLTDGQQAGLRLDEDGGLIVSGITGGGGGTFNGDVNITDVGGNPVSTSVPVTVVAGGGVGGTSSNFGSAFPTPGTAVGMSNGTNMVPFKTTDGVTLDVAIPANTFNNNADNVSTTATNGKAGAFAYVWDGSAWDRLPGNSTDGLTVNLGLNNDITCSNCGGTGDTGTTVPTSAAYMGVNIGGNLVGVTPGVAGTPSSQIFTVQGVASMTPILATIGSNSSVNLNQIGGSAVSAGSGTSDAGTQRIALATDSPGILVAGTAGSPSSQVVSMQGVVGGTPVPVSSAPTTSGGLSRSYASLANSTNATVVKASAGQIYTMRAFNNSANIAYLKFYNKATTPTCNSDTVVDKVMIPASTSGAGVVINSPVGTEYTTGIAYCVTAAFVDSDNTAVAASAFSVTIGYK